MRIQAVEPTVFFRREQGALQQIARVTVDNSGEATDGTQLKLHWDGGRASLPLGPVPDGTSTHEVAVPDIREPGTIRFELLAGGQTVDGMALDWEPERHWEVFLVQVSHHDLGFTDLPTNVLQEHIGFLDDVVRYCEQTGDWPDDARFRYTIEAGWSVQQYVESRSPEVVERLMQLVRDGRVEVNALFGNETSELCGHEEQIRLLYPSFALKRRYGIPILTAELNDVPGLSWGLASVLAGAGVRYFSPRLPTYFTWGDLKVHNFWDDEAVTPGDLSTAFWWEAIDGSRVLLWYGYRMWLWTFEQSVEELPGHLVSHRRRGYPSDVIRFGFESSGRDNAPPDVRLSVIARQWNERWAYPRMVVATNRMFFEELERREGSRLRVLRGDLPNTDYTVGALSTARETAINRVTHDVLSSAEKLAACAAEVADYAYPAERLSEAYDLEMLYDEHTWGMGHPVGPAHEANWSDKGRFAYRAAALAQDLLLKSTNRIADQVRLRQDGYHLVVFNPLGSGRSDLVMVPGVVPPPCERPMYWSPPGAGDLRAPTYVSSSLIGREILNLPQEVMAHPFELIDVGTGTSVPYQVITLDDPLAARPLAAHHYALGGCDPSERRALAFVAQDVPPLGYRTYRLVPVERRPAFRTSLHIAGSELESRFFRVRLDPGSGVVASMIDKETGREWVDCEARHGCNQVMVRWARTGEEVLAGRSRITAGEAGPVLASLIVRAEEALPGCPQRTQEIVLYDSLKRIDFANRLLKDATPLMEVYVAFPFALAQPQFRFEAGNTVIEPIRDQMPGSNTDAYAMQHWVNAWDADGGIVWASLDAPVMELGGLWPGYVSQAHHCVTPPGFGHEFLRSPAQLDKGHIYSYVFANNFRTNFSPVQVADVLFRYSLTTHRGDWPAARVSSFGWAASTPLAAAGVAGPQEGMLPAVATFCQLDAANVSLVALKQAEDGDGLIVRLAEVEGRATRVELTLPYFQIGQAFATNLVEENQRALHCERHRARVEVPAYGIATVRCRAGTS